MLEIQYGMPESDSELLQILELQRLNSEDFASAEEVRDQGFVTVRHDLELLRDMHLAAPAVIARSEGQVAAYALVMLREFENRIPILKPMFEMISGLSYKGRSLEEYSYCVTGQICVGKPFRGRGLFDGLYRAMRERLCGQFELVITEVATRNGRSLAAHRRVGFEILQHYRDDRGEDWELIVWDWR